MIASLFKRIFSSFIDLCLLLVVVYGLFFIGGRSLLQNRVDSFDIVYADYNEVIAAYNEDLANLRTEYDANVALADGNEELETAALETYNLRVDLLNQQNTIDINPYNLPLTQYFSEIIYFFVIGFIVLATVLTLALTGKTPGRRVMKVHLASQDAKGDYVKPNLVQVFLHDILLKYFLVVVVFTINMYYGVMFMLFGLLVDVILISFTRNKMTLRDLLTKSQVQANV